MSAELLNLCLGFQPDAPELKPRLEYNSAAKKFANEAANVSAQHWLKGADTPQDILEVSIFRELEMNLTDHERFSTLL
jgi:COP9 signalosome complex subunit 3